MEAIIRPMSRQVVELIKIMKVSIMFSGICRYRKEVYNFYAFAEQYNPEKGYPDRFLLESMDGNILFNRVLAEDCEVVWSPQAKVKYTFTNN